MRIGAVFPQFEFGSDPVAIRDYAQAAEELGYTHIGADDHVIGANPDRTGGWNGWVTYHTPFFEPFVLFSFMASVTRKVEFETCVLLLPQRQTVLVAKQAASLDVLSGGRLRLGVGIGWSTVEYQSLNEDMHTRGRRVEEQVKLLRCLWTKEHLDFSGDWHTVPDAGINPLPVQRPIPIWFGGQSDPVIRRAARMGDGWMPLYDTPQQAAPGLALLDRELAAAERTRAEVGFEARVPYSRANADEWRRPDEWRRLLDGWRAAGATHISLITTGCGLSTPGEHIAALRKFREAASAYADGISIR